MVNNYSIILIMILTVLGAGVVLLSLGILFRPYKPNKRKLSPYESGVPDVEPLKGRSFPMAQKPHESHKPEAVYRRASK